MSRAAHQCHKTGCDSEAEWQLYLKFAALGFDGKTVMEFHMQSSLKCCDRHRRHAAEWVIKPAHLDTIADGLARERFHHPHPGSIKIEFERLPRERSVIELRSAPKIMPCDRTGCVMPAKYQIALRLWQIGQNKSRSKPMTALTNYCVCARHSKEMSAADVLDPVGKSKLLGDLTARGIPMPDFASAELQLVPMGQGRKADPVEFAKAG